MRKPGVRWLGEGLQSHFLSDHSGDKGGFIGSSIFIAHRPGISDGILYNYYIHRAINLYGAVVFYPFLEPFRLPIELRVSELEPETLNRKRLKKASIYRLKTRDFEQDKTNLENFYAKLIASKNRQYPFVIVVDTLKKWHPVLEEHIRILIHESSISFGSVIIHCPLSIVPPDLLSVFGNVMAVWPSKYEIELLNTHFPSENVPVLTPEEETSYNSWMLVFNSKPVEERGWQWKKFSPIT